MTDERLDVLLIQVRDVAIEIGSFIEGRTRNDLASDLMRERAVAMSLFILADLIAKIASAAPDFVRGHPDVPWTKIRGFRNHLAHSYFGMERDIIWQTATVSVPALLAALADSLPPQITS